MRKGTCCGGRLHITPYFTAPKAREGRLFTSTLQVNLDLFVKVEPRSKSIHTTRDLMFYS